MKKIVYHFLAALALLVFTGCASALMTGTGDTFHDKWMGVGCTGTDVKDWQTFLVANNYLVSNAYTPGTFDSIATMPATVLFQSKCGIHNDPAGKVGPNSWLYATKYVTNTGGGHNLVSADHQTPTVESQTGCSN